MPRRKRSTETIVGIFVLISLALLLAVVTLMGSRQNIFAKRYQITGEFDSVAGLQTGAEVHLAGINIGHVQDIEFSPNNRVLVTMSVSWNQIDRIRGDSIASIRTMGLMGDRYVEITVGTESEKLIEPGGSIRTSELFELTDMVEEVRPTLENVENAMKNISILTDELADPNGEVGTILENVKVLTTDAREGKGTVGALFVRDDIHQKANQVLDTTQEAMENLKVASGNVKEASVEFPTIIDGVSSSVEQFEEFSVRATDAADGFADMTDSGKLVMDDVAVISANLRSASEDIKGATPRLGPLLVSAEDGVTGAKEVVEAAKRNWLFRGYFEPPRPGEPIAVSGRDITLPEVTR
jgi:phospholipid/cholesterol/gamma-HCH transport system substrate-binding protein